MATSSNFNHPSSSSSSLSSNDDHFGDTDVDVEQDHYEYGLTPDLEWFENVIKSNIRETKRYYTRNGVLNMTDKQKILLRREMKILNLIKVLYVAISNDMEHLRTKLHKLNK